MTNDYAFRATAWILSIMITIAIPAPATAANQSAMDPSGCRLPPMDDIINEALAFLPKSVTDYNNLKRRMRMSVLLPEVQLQYGLDQSNYNLESRRRSGLRWEGEGRIVLSWDLSELVFHNQEADAIGVYQRTRRDEIDLRSQIAADYAELNTSLDLLRRETNRGSLEWNARAEQNAAKIDALTSNRFGLVGLVQNCTERASSG